MRAIRGRIVPPQTRLSAGENSSILIQGRGNIEGRDYPGACNLQDTSSTFPSTPRGTARWTITPAVGRGLLLNHSACRREANQPADLGALADWAAGWFATFAGGKNLEGVVALVAGVLV